MYNVNKASNLFWSTEQYLYKFHVKSAAKTILSHTTYESNTD